ncbi:MAG: hypothetical protein U0168_28850 [Nannocystaceae bacterium]
MADDGGTSAGATSGDGGHSTVDPQGGSSGTADGSGGSSDDGTGTTAAASTGTASSSSSSGDATTTAEGTATAGSSGGSSSSGGDPCPPGTLGCACDDGSCDDGTCIDDTCTAPVCGNGVIDGDDLCDDGNAAAQDGCEPDCTPSQGVAALAVGDQHACARFHDGRLRCFGYGAWGKLGYGDAENVGDDENPASKGDVDLGGVAVIAAAGGREHTCVVLDGGDVRCFGFNNWGALGNPLIAFQTGYGDEPGESPALLPAVPMPAPAVAVTCGAWHSCALLDGGDVQCWGHNPYGQLGYGSTELGIGDDEPADDEGLVDLGGAAIAIDSQGHHNCALLDDGTVRCWGLNDEGQLGIGSFETIGDDELPSSVAVALPAAALDVQVGAKFSCALLDDGTVHCWGRNAEGQAGLGDTVGHAVPAAAAALGDDVVALAVGAGHVCAQLGDGQDLRCWGDANFGRLGYGIQPEQDIGDDELPSSMAPVALPEPPLRAIALGDAHSCARVGDGAIVCWGGNTSGQNGQPGVPFIGDDETPADVGTIVIE